MSEHCMINGKRCSKCCEVLTIRVDNNFKLWCRHTQKYGIADEFDASEHPVDAAKLYAMLKPITKRQAKKINPHLVSRVGGSQSYFTCAHHTADGCSNYEGRPQMCSGYPLYGRAISEWVDSLEFKRGGLYIDDCTYYLELKDGQ